MRFSHQDIWRHFYDTQKESAGLGFAEEQDYAECCINKKAWKNNTFLYNIKKKNDLILKKEGKFNILLK